MLDAAPVAAGQLYVVDTKPVVSTVTGTVSTLKSATGGAVVKNRSAGARRAYVADLDRAFGT